jgi:GYF domain 2
MANRRFYFVRKNGQETGPYSVSQLAEQWKSGTITADDEIREDGGTGRWYPVRDFSKQLDRGRESEGQAYSGPARAAWILLFITCGISIVPVLGFAAWIVAAPILLAAFVLSIIVLSRGGTAEGLMLLLATIVGAPLVIAVAPVVSSMLAAAIASSSQHHTASLPSPPRSERSG